MHEGAPSISVDTHEVRNQPPPLEDYNLFDADCALVEALAREGGDWARDHVRAYGEQLGRRETIEFGFLANRHVPELQTHDRYGNRIDEVVYHPAYHVLMRAGMAAEVHSFAWTHERPGAFVARAALGYMAAQIEAGVGCPLTMTFAAVPTLRMQPEIAEEWVPRLLKTEYDPRFIPAHEKHSATVGMAMTEKQGGSDVRANTTAARAIGSGGPGGEYLLTGHKWFCSAPMSDAFLTLAQTSEGLSCFLVPRWLPDGTRNHVLIQRLKDKLGNRSNASGEIEYRDTWARMVGEPGRGVRTIIEMVNHTRLDCTGGSAGLMRQAVVQAVHHAQHRDTFGKRLADHALMQNVLADLALESEAATTLTVRLARAFDDARQDAARRPFARVATAIGKYWVCKRALKVTYEAMECLGGNGYVEESIMPRLYREAPVNSIWEGSGNVMCLDVLRATARDPDSVEALRTELRLAVGIHGAYDAFVGELEVMFSDWHDAEYRARHIVERLALALQAGLMLRHAPEPVALAFCDSRLACEGHEYGTLATGTDVDAVLGRVLSAVKSEW